MFVPYGYDAKNRDLYSSAKANNELIIQEFSSTMEGVLVDECKANSTSKKCETDELFIILSKKKLIASDYVKQMENKINLSFKDFVISVCLYIILLLLLVGLIAHFVTNYTLRFLALIGSFLLVLFAFHVTNDLPHKNTKYYYIFGALYAALLSVSDFFHRLEVTSNLKGLDEKDRTEVATVKYQKWSSVFQFSIGILAALVGTVSFTVLGHIRTIFGESFVFYPLIGILISIGLLSLIFYWGVLRNLLLILDELEKELAK